MEILMTMQINYTEFNNTVVKPHIAQTTQGSNLAFEFTTKGRIEVGDSIMIRYLNSEEEFPAIVIGIKGSQLPVKLLMAVKEGVGVTTFSGEWGALLFDDLVSWETCREKDHPELNAYMNVNLVALALSIEEMSDFFDDLIETRSMLYNYLTEDGWIDQQKHEIEMCNERDALKFSNCEIDTSSTYKGDKESNSSDYVRFTNPYNPCRPPYPHPVFGYPSQPQQPPMGYSQSQQPQPGFAGTPMYHQQPPMGQQAPPGFAGSPMHQQQPMYQQNPPMGSPLQLSGYPQPPTGPQPSHHSSDFGYQQVPLGGYPYPKHPPMGQPIPPMGHIQQPPMNPTQPGFQQPQQPQRPAPAWFKTPESKEKETLNTKDDPNNTDADES